MSENYWISLAQDAQFKGKFQRLERLLDDGFGFEEAVSQANISKQDIQQFMQVVTAEYERNKTRKVRGKSVVSDKDETTYHQVMNGLRAYCSQR